MRTATGDILRYDLPGIASACLIPEHSPLLSGGPGDAVLVDPSSGVIAVADSPDRNPAAAGIFLESFYKCMRTPGLLEEEGSLRPSAFHDLVSLTDRLVRETPYHCSTTFSSIVLIDPRTAGLLHTGDSLIFLSRSRSDIIQLSRTNHFMIGRAPRLYQAEIVTLPADGILLLASDGLTELAGSFGMSIRDFLSWQIRFESPAELIQGLVDISLGAGKHLDDLGAVAAVPSLMGAPYRGTDGPALLKMQHTKYKED